MKTHLVFGLLTAILLVVVIGSRQRASFGFEDVVVMAEKMARENYLSAVPILPPELARLNYDQLREIRWKNDRTLWRREGLPFQARFYHLGSTSDRPVQIYALPDSATEPLRYSQDFFDFGSNVFREKFPETLGYAGFRIHHPLNKPDVLDELVSFLGASYFRALPKDLQYGASARGLAINTEPGKAKEEFPAFTKFWLQRPDRYGKHMTIYALLEGPSVTGAYQFSLHPGVETGIHVKAVLFFRKKTERPGYAPLTSMFWFGENTSNTFGDFRPEVHDSDGLLLQRSTGEWIWRPLAWSQQLQVNVFADDHPKGFGLLQRDRDFNHYQDLEALYHKRPSVWVQPHWGFDKGAVKLLQLPTKDEYLDNVIAFWTPAAPPPLLQPVRLEYTLRWLGDADDLPPVGRAISTRVDDQDKPYYRHFFIEFAAAPQAPWKAEEIPAPDIASSTGTAITESKIEWNDFNKTWRVSFYASTPENNRPHELTCRLLIGGQAVTETWSYTWMP
jgi:glucans biosynthesis protein